MSPDGRVIRKPPSWQSDASTLRNRGRLVGAPHELPCGLQLLRPLDTQLKCSGAQVTDLAHVTGETASRGLLGV